ncbi:MAG: CoA-binding protein [Armatimonadetes bacterium]|nr:CoA-binding protein [Armatimonadota bacterium]
MPDDGTRFGGETAAQFRPIIDAALGARSVAVLGASRDPAKYGHKVYTSMKRAGYKVYAVNPNADDIDGDTVYPQIDCLPERPDLLITVTPPAATEAAMQAAGHADIRIVWMQPGSESEAAVNLARSHGMQAVFGGPCVMVAVATRSWK